MAASDLHTRRPSVYLDQWVWIDLARAEAGKPRRASDVQVLAALREAAAGGVAFPLSATQYFETTKIKDPRQRRDLARVMATVSYFRTLRHGRHLMRHQMLNAMHESFGRPTFRPRVPEPMGLGVAFAFTGEQGLMTVRDRSTDQETTEDALPGVGALRRKIAQLAELLIIAGPADDQVATLRQTRLPSRIRQGRGGKPPCLGRAIRRHASERSDQRHRTTRPGDGPRTDS